MAESTQQLIKRGARLVRDAAATNDRTSHLRDLADVLVELRSRFDYEGLPDWAGRSWDYRMAAQELYESSGVKPDVAAHIQAVVRYHVGNVLRRRVSQAELKKVGLLQRSPKERIKDTRDETQKVLAAVDAVVSRETITRLRAVRLATAASACLERLLDVPIDELDPSERKALKVALAEMDEMVSDLERKLVGTAKVRR